MKKLAYALGMALLCLFTACSTQEGSSDAGDTLSSPVRGGKYYGGIFRMNESEYLRSLDPPAITDVYSYRIAAQLFEGLYAFNDETLEVEPRLAKSVEIDSTGTIYTFELQEDVYFHDDLAFASGKGRKLRAEDVAYCLTRLCTADAGNQNFHLLSGILKGADAYYQATQKGYKPAEGVSGIEVVNSRVLRLHLTRPFALFPVHLAQPACYIYPEEAVMTYGEELRIHPIGTGPFRLGAVEENISLALPKNPNYWRKDEFGNVLPFLDALNVQFINSKKSEFFEFRKGNLDMLYRLPTEHIIEILEESNERGEAVRYQLQREPEMVTQFLAFNLAQQRIFRDKNLRKAFSYAIDREKILTYVLNNEGYAAGTYGITPPVFPQYPSDSIHGYRLNVDSARYYLAKAGYPNGRNFPPVTLMLNAEGDRNTNVAIEIQKQLNDHLNIEIEVETYPFAQLLEKGYEGDFDVLRTAWYADYPSPENFLWIFYSGKEASGKLSSKHPNITRYKNVEFNRLFERALHAPKVEEANRLFRRAEQLLMDDAPVLVLWYDEAYRLLQPYVRDFPINAMQYRDLSEVYFQKARTLRSQ